MGTQLEFDRENFRFTRKRLSVRSVLRRSVWFLLSVLTLSLVFWLLASVFITTDSGRQLRRENRMYKRQWGELKARRRLLEDGVQALQLRDALIYREVFHTEAPSAGGPEAAQYLADTDTVPDRRIVAYTEKKLEALSGMAAGIEERWRAIAARVARDAAALPPLSLPLKEISYAQVGASVGLKVNPFYKVPVRHDGLDLIAPQGTPVYATAAGTVSRVTRSAKGLGDVVEIRHPGAYLTRYAHLGDISVAEGASVRAGERIGTVGMSGKSFAPHLHYEVLREDQVLDPVYHLAGRMRPADFVNVIFMSVNTGQSMD